MPASDEPEGSPWLWGLLGAAGTALLGVGGSLLLRRRRVAEAQGPPDPATPEPPRPVPVAPPPGLRPPAPRSADPFEIVLNPLRIALEADGAVLDLELLVRNSQAAPAEGIRIALAMMSANPEQDAAVAGFHAAPQGEPVGPPFDLPAGGGGRLPVRLTLPGERVHVVEIGGRPIFVPMVLVDLRWRAGLSIRRYGADFMVGTAGQGSKPGPIRVDRGTPAGPLAATRYVAKAAAAA